MDVVVTVPKDGWQDWLAEGHRANEPSLYVCPDYHWFGRGAVPPIVAGERVYIVAHGRLRGYALLIRLEQAKRGWQPEWWWPGCTWALVRRDRAVPVTIDETIRGFPGWRVRWWPRTQEHYFPEWQTAGLPAQAHATPCRR